MRKRDIQREKQALRGESLSGSDSLAAPATTPPTPLFFSPRPDWTSLVELIRYSQSLLSNAHLSSALCHGWNERLRSFVDHYPCHILLQHCLFLQRWVARINWEGKGGQGFDPCFPLYPPPCNVCILMAEVSQLDTHLSFSDVGKQPWSDKDLRFSREQTSTHTLDLTDLTTSLLGFFDGWILLLFVFHVLICIKLFLRCILSDSTHPYIHTYTISYIYFIFAAVFLGTFDH